MARTVRDSRLETREARNKLPARKKPHWKTLRPGELHIGYVRLHRNEPGYWTVRRYIGVGMVPQGASPYRVARLPGVADDFETANDKTVLSYRQAQDLALARQDERRGVSGPITVRAAIEAHVARLRLEKKTGDDADIRAKAHIIPQLGDALVHELTTDQLIRWRDALAASPARMRSRKANPLRTRKAPTTEDEKRARRATANRTWNILRAALNSAFERGLVHDDLAWRRVKSFQNVGAARQGFLSIVEAKRLVNAADADSGFRDLVRAALATGMRYGELCALRVRDFQRGKLHVAQSKSGRARDVVLNAEGEALFGQLTAGRGRDQLLLPQKERSDAWGKSEQARPMRAACRAAKIAPAVGFHQLRHTWASLAVMNGMPLMVVARNLGHADTRMVELHYGHLTQEYVDKEVRASAPTFGMVRPTSVTPMRRRARA